MELGAKKNGVSDDEKGVSDWSGVELNHRHTDFQSVALPTELPDPRCTKSDTLLTKPYRCKVSSRETDATTRLGADPL